MAKLTLIDGKLRIDWAGSDSGSLVLSDSDEDPCCCGTCDVNESSYGGPGTTERTYTFPYEEYDVEFTWEAYSIPDAFTVEVGGQTVVDTGSVSGNGTKCFKKPAGETEVKVTVVGPEGTAWTYSLKCHCTCADDPGDGAVLCFTVYDYPADKTSVSGTFYGGIGGQGFITEPPASAGFPLCVQEKYTLKGYVASGVIDDYGSIAGINFDNHVPCCIVNGVPQNCPPPSPPAKITTITGPSELFDVEFVAHPDDAEKFFIPIPYSATSSNCGAPSGVNASVCITFTKKEEVPL